MCHPLHVFFVSHGGCRAMRALIALVALVGMAGGAVHQWPGHCGDAQHTAQSPVRTQCLQEVRWSLSLDQSFDIAEAHYGSPLVTAAGTVIAAQRLAVQGTFRIVGMDGNQRGRILWEEESDFLYPAHGWVPLYQMVLSGPPGPSQRVYWPAVGGGLRFRDNLDSSSGALTRGLVAFMGEQNYTANQDGLRDHVFVNSAMATGPDGAVYFTIRVQGALPQAVTDMGISRGLMIRASRSGETVVVSAADVGGDNEFRRFPNQLSPAFSNDYSTLYTCVGSQNYNGPTMVVGLDPNTLQVRLSEGGRSYRRMALDPRSASLSCHLFEDSSSSIMVAPDGDVYYGLLGNPNRYTGWLLRWNAELTTSKPPGGFGWDNTPSVVPASLVPSYNGSSTYLLAAKFNSYAGLEGGQGLHHLVLLDPASTETDSMSGLQVMRVVQRVLAPTPDPGVLSTYPNARKEWCTNTAAVDTVSGVVIANNEVLCLLLFIVGSLMKSSRTVIATNGILQVTHCRK